jgi:hypothetical protein
MVLEVSFALVLFAGSSAGEKRDIDDIVLRQCSNSV